MTRIKPRKSRQEEGPTLSLEPRHRLLDRLPPTASRVKALRDIHWKLAIATEIFQRFGDGGREGVFQAVTDVVEYFSDLGIPRATLQPLAAVADAITDAKRGTASPIFKPKRRGRVKPPTSITQLQFEGILVIITECCILYLQEKGERKVLEPGCKLAARMINSQ